MSMRKSVPSTPMASKTVPAVSFQRQAVIKQKAIAIPMATTSKDNPAPSTAPPTTYAVVAPTRSSRAVRRNEAKLPVIRVHQPGEGLCQ